MVDRVGLLDDKPLKENSFLDQAMERINTQDNDRLSSSIQMSQELNPDQHARTLKQSQRHELPPSLVRDHLDRLENMPDIDPVELRKNSPATAEFMSDVNNAAVARDDVGVLGTIESWLNSAAKIPGEVVQNTTVSFEQHEQMLLNFRAFTGEIDEASSRRLQFLEENPEPIQDGVIPGIGQEAIRSAVTTFDILGTGFAGGAVTGAAGLAVGGVGAIPAFGAGFTTASAFRSYQVSAGEAYGEFKRFKDTAGVPVDDDVARGGALIAGLANAGLEFIAIHKIADSIPGFDRLVKFGGKDAVRAALRAPTVQAALGRLGKAMLEVGVTEALTEVGQESVLAIVGELTKVASGNDAPFTSPGLFTPEEDVDGNVIGQPVISRLWHAATVGFVAGNAFAIPGSSLQFVRDVQRIDQAETNRDIMTALGDGARDSKLLARLPEKFKEAVAEMTKGGALEQMHIDAQVFSTYFQDQDLSGEEVYAAITGSSEGYAEAVGGGFDLVINTSDYAASIAASDHHQGLMDHVRFDADQMSPAEARKASEQFKAQFDDQVQAVTEEMTKQGEIESETRQIHTQVRDQLVAAGRTADIAENEATLTVAYFRAMAEREGIDPRELFESAGLTIERVLDDPQGGELILQQEAAFRNSPVFRREIMGATFLDVVSDPDGYDIGEQVDEVMASDLPAEIKNFVRALERDGFLGFERLFEAVDAAVSDIDSFEVSQGLKASLGKLMNNSEILFADQFQKNLANFDQSALAGAPTVINIPERGDVEFGIFDQAVEAAKAYADAAGIDYENVSEYTPIEQQRAEMVAEEFERMPHDPGNREVKEAYRTMIDETLEQFRAILDTGLQIEFIRGEDPYKNTPREAILDVIENGHLWVFSTREGFGSDANFDPADNPLLEETEFEIDGVKLLANDVFRIVHDYFGHIKNGNGFRAGGEENAWQAHAAMYSPQARRAMTTETRGQNSWVNYGPHGEANRKASGSDTIYADQKIGLLPLWVSEEGRLSGRSRERVAAGYTQGLEGAIRPDGRLELVHWSPNRFDRNNPLLAGTGKDRRSRRARADGTFFGIVSANENGYRIEAGLGHNRHIASVDPGLLYPAHKDPEGLWVQGNPQASVEAMRDAGFIGYWADDVVLGKVAIVFDEIPVESVNDGKLLSEQSDGVSFNQDQAPADFTDIQELVGLTDEQVAATALGLMSGKPVSDTVSTPGYNVPKIGKLSDVVPWLNERRLATGLPKLDITNEADRQIIADMLTAEAVAARRVVGEDSEWYDTVIQRTIEAMSLKYPELKTDENARNAFLLAVAISSQNLDVEANLRLAIKQYDAFSKDGSFPVRGSGGKLESMKGNFARVNKLLDALGPEKLREFLITEYKAGEINPFKKTGELVDEPVLGSIVFGPKIGFGFYSNLTGNFEPVTIDMWLMRTMGRLTGTLPRFDEELFTKQIDRFRKALGVRGKKSEGIFAAQFDKALRDEARNSTEGAIALMRLVKSRFERDFKENRKDYDAENRKKTELVLAAQTMALSLDQPVDAPGSGSELRNRRDIIRRMVDKFETVTGERVAPASLQALIWYPEQELYKALGVSLKVTSQDYFGAATKILAEENINVTEQLGERAGPGADGARRGDGGTDRAGSGQAGGRGQSISGLQGSERTGLLEGLNLNQDTFNAPGPKGPRGQIQFNEDRSQAVIRLFESADLSTYLHESGHLFLELTKGLAERDGASAGLQADWAAILDWLGVESGDQIKVEHHEKWARGFEAYLAEGKAPSADLRAAFSRFRAWMISVYRNLSSLNVELSDDIRGVMDRMLAGDDAIRQYNNSDAAAPLWPDAASAGMTEAGYARYLKTLERARMSAEEGVSREIMAEMTREQKQWWRDAKARKRDEVEIELRKRPVYRALLFLQGEDVPEGIDPVKLSKAALVEMYGDAKDAVWRRLPFGKNAVWQKADGVHPDAIAEAFGYDSGDALVQDIVNSPTLKKAIEQETDARMKAEFGDMLADNRIPDMVAEAVNGNDRADVLRAELKQLGRQSKRDLAPAEILKQAAEKIIGEKRLRDIRPESYRVAGDRAARAALEAAAKGDVEMATQFKQQQLLNLYLYRQARDAKKREAKAVKYFKKFDKTRVRQRMGKAGYLEQIDALLQRFELKPRSQKVLRKRESLQKFIESKAEDGIVPNIPDDLLNEAFAVNFREMTPEELQGLEDSVRALEHIAQLKNKLIDAREKRDLDQIVDDSIASIEGSSKGPRENKAETRGFWADVAHLGNGILAGHRKLSSMIRQLDGHKDRGPLWNLIMRRINEAGDAEAVMNEESAEALARILKPLENTNGIVNPRKVHIPAIGESLSLNARVAVMLNWGNLDNRQRLMDGKQWSEAQIMAIINTLTESEMLMVQEIWDYVDSFWPAIAAKEERVTGLAPDKVDAAGFTTRHGNFRGGYYPLKYEDRESAKAGQFTDKEVAEQMMRGAVTSSTTRRGHTKARAENVKEPVRLDTGVLFEHVSQVVHDLSHHEMLIDVNRIVRRLEQTILDHYGVEFKDAIKSSLEDIASGGLGAQQAMERGFAHLRNGVTIAYMGWSFSTASLQPIGLTQSLVRVGLGPVLKAYSRWFGDAVKMESRVEEIHAMSPFMRLRHKTLNREIAEIRNRINKDRRINAIEETYFYMISKMQMVVDIPTWMAAYDSAIGEGHETAVAFADQTVIDTQSAGQIKDLAQVQRGGPLMKLFTNFYSYFSALYNLSAESVNRTNFRDPLSIGRLAADYMLLYMIPSVMTMLLREAFKGSDDDETFVKKVAKEQAGMFLGTMIGARDISGALNGFGYQGPAGLAFFGQIAGFGVQASQGEIDEPFLKALNRAAGIFFHYPALQTERTVEGAHRLMTGDTDNPAELLTGERK